MTSERHGSLGRRFTAALLAIVTTVLVGLTTHLTIVDVHIAEGRLEEHLTEICRQAEVSLANAPWQYNHKSVADFLDSLFLSEAIVFAEVLAEGRTVVRKTRAPADMRGFRFYSESPNCIVRTTAIRHKGEIVGQLRLAATRGTIRRVALKSMTTWVGVLLVLAVVITLTTLLLVRHYILTPLEQLRISAIAIAAGDLDAPIDSSSQDEIGQLAEAFATMMRDLKSTMASRDELNREIARRQEVEEELQRGRQSLEEQVASRTIELNERTEDAELLNRAMVNLLEDMQATNTQLDRSTRELQAANHELEAFSYSVSHDLRAPLRAINGFSSAIAEDYADVLDEEGKDHLQSLCDASRQMGRLIDALLRLSRISRRELHCETVDLTRIAETIVDQLSQAHPEHIVEFVSRPGLAATADAKLLEIVLQNLLENAWKFTGKRTQATVEFGTVECPAPKSRTDTAHEDGVTRLGPRGSVKAVAYYIRDNGAGFDMAFADKLFGAFQRLHRSSEFEGIGIGLATVQRIIHRHGGLLWAEAKEGEGATFYFTLP